MSSKKVLLVTSFFEEEIGYQEVQLAQVLRAKGHRVMVLTTDRSYLHKERRLSGEDKAGTIFRITRMLRLRDTVFPLQSVATKIAGFEPDVALLIHPGHGLSYFAMKSISRQSKVVSFFGDLRVDNKLAQVKGLKGSPFVQQALKNRWYRKVFRRADLIVANTNETSDILKQIAGDNLTSKLIMPGLGYDPGVYNYRPPLRAEWRKEMGFKDDDIVVATVTRIIEGKPVEKWVEPVLGALSENSCLVYVLAGFMNDEYSSIVKASLNRSEFKDRLVLLDFTGASENNKIFNGADYSLWFAPTTSIQQSMASGLPAILPLDGTLDHLVADGKNGLYYRDFQELRKTLRGLSGSVAPRQEIVEINERFSYDHILEALFSRLGW
jgi:glycosyltransferase involved in cell wall biosynthesis